MFFLDYAVQNFFQAFDLLRSGGEFHDRHFGVNLNVFWNKRKFLSLVHPTILLLDGLNGLFLIVLLVIEPLTLDFEMVNEDVVTKTEFEVVIEPEVKGSLGIIGLHWYQNTFNYEELQEKLYLSSIRNIISCQLWSGNSEKEEILMRGVWFQQDTVTNKVDMHKYLLF